LITTDSFKNYLLDPVDNSPLIVFRQIFGILITLESWGAIATGWVREIFIKPEFTFTFIGFEWLQPLPGNGMYFYYGVMGVLGLMVTFGCYYRMAIISFALLWTGTYLMQKTAYNNHYYLLILLSWMMAIVPANTYRAYDSKFKRVKSQFSCPRWVVLIFILQTGMVFIFAGIAKIYPDWLNALPISIWFDAKSNMPIIGKILKQEWFRWLVVYGGLAFDLLIFPMLLWQKTRLFGFIASIFFHLFNSIIFQIGIFPYMALALSIFFFKPESIRKIFFKRRLLLEELPKGNHRWKPLLMLALGLFFTLQLMLPLRHRFYPGNVHWTEEGHRMSWRMMLRVKQGSSFYVVKDNVSDKQWREETRDYLTFRQASKVATRPDMAWQFAQYLEDKYHEKGYNDVSVYCHSKVSLNGRDYYPLIDPDVDLAKTEWKRFSHSNWIMPLIE